MSERVPSERAREVARDWLLERFGHSTWNWREVESLRDLLTRYAAEARLEEAKWWRDNFAGCIHRGQWKGCKACDRIAALEQQLKEGG